MVCIAMGMWGSVCIYIIYFICIYIYIYIYACVQASRSEVAVVLYITLSPPVDPRASRFHVHLRNVVCFYPHTNTRPPLSRCNPHTEDLAPRRPPGRGGLIATARNPMYLHLKGFFICCKRIVLSPACYLFERRFELR